MKHTDPLVENTRAATWRALVLLVLIYSAAGFLVNFAVGPPGSNVRGALGIGERMTGGLLQPTLMVSPFFFAVLLPVIFGVARLRCADVGFRLSAIGPAVLVTLGFWVAMQVGLVLWVSVAGGPLQWNDAWWDASNGWGARVIVGTLLAQIFGNALIEEMVFRGVLLPQFYLKALRRFGPCIAMVSAVLGSQSLFALTHLPNRLFVNVLPAEALLADQLELLLYGTLFSALYLLTRNIFVCVGLHSLLNQPARLMAVPFSPGVKSVWWALVLVLLTSWPIARRFAGRVRAEQ